MRVLRLGDDGSGRLIPGEAAKPAPGARDVVVRVVAAGVTPTEAHWQPTTHTQAGRIRQGAVPCHEFSGVADSVGSRVREFGAGDEVYGMNDWYAEGGLEEFCVAPASSLATKPSRLTHFEAATVPIGALTSWQGLYERARLQPGERVLIHGGAGAVGIFAIQLAKLRGAYVITTTSAADREFAMGLGADEAIDYQGVQFEDRVRDLDVVFDAMGGDTLARSWTVLKPKGRMVTIASNLAPDADERTKRAFFIVEPNRAQLIELGKLFALGRLKTFVGAVIPIAEATNIFQLRTRGKREHGKLVVAVSDAAGVHKRRANQ
jgi:NADPH:quinone reductase-like Zn-dependent oxidoreductase